MTMDLSGMSREELLKLRKNVDKALREAEERERREAVNAAQKAVAEYGFSLDELTADIGATKRRSKSRPKYRNPDAPEQTWSGRGRKPKWVHEALARGLDISALKI